MKSNEVQIALPDERYTLIEYEVQRKPAVATVNSALVGFAHRDIFRWHLSLIVDFSDLIENDMPSESEREIVDAFGDELDAGLKAPPELPNALFLARMTWNGTRQLLYRIYDPEQANAYLQSVIAEKKHPRPIDYRMEDDPEWRHAKWFLDAVSGNE
ncbi:MAG: DUF695 domain-containing protein [bacterium]|nr:DUF695 domain-containing protein [bacterium]